MVYFLIFLHVAWASVVDEIEGRISEEYIVDAHFDKDAETDTNFWLNFKGRHINCAIPDRKIREKQVSGVVHSNIGIFLTQNLTDTTISLKRNEWWYYDVKFGDYILQYHEDRDGFKQTNQDPTERGIVLGKWKEPRNSTLPEDFTNTISSPISFIEKVEDGALCDLTQKPRETTLHYLCGGITDETYISEIEEFATCKYRVEIRTPLLCPKNRVSMYISGYTASADTIDCFFDNIT